MFTRMGPLMLMAALMAGCATVDPQAGFDDVQADVQERLDESIQWHGGTAEDAQVEQALGELLTSGGALTADAAVQVALLNNRRLQATYEDLAISQAELVQAGLLSNPVFDAAVQLPIDGGPTKVELTLVQNFLDVLFIPLRKKAAAAAFEAAKLRVTSEVLGLAGQTREAFYDVQASQQTVEMLEHVVASTAASLELMQRLREAGNVRELDLHTEQAMHEQARLELAAAQATLAESRERLNVLMGLWGARLDWTVTDRLRDLPPPEDAVSDDLEREAVRRSLDLAAARAEIDQLHETLGLTRAASILPEMELGPTAEREEGEWSVGPAISAAIPIFDQGQARSAGASARLRQRRHDFAATAVEVRAAARLAAQQLHTARRIAEHYRDVMLPLRQRITDATQLQYNAMQLGTFQLLEAQRNQIAAARGYIEALRDYWIARSRVELIRAGHVPETNFEININTGRAATGSTGPNADEGEH